VWNSSTGAINTGQSVATGTSPSIADLPSGGYEVAFQSGSGLLETYTPSGAATNEEPVAPGSSPAITAIPGVGYEVAWEGAGNDILDLSDGPNEASTTMEPMRPGTSPALTQ